LVQVDGTVIIPLTNIKERVFPGKTVNSKGHHFVRLQIRIEKVFKKIKKVVLAQITFNAFCHEMQNEEKH